MKGRGRGAGLPSVRFIVRCPSPWQRRPCSSGPRENRDPFPKATRPRPRPFRRPDTGCLLPVQKILLPEPELHLAFREIRSFKKGIGPGYDLVRAESEFLLGHIVLGRDDKLLPPVPKGHGQPGQRAHDDLPVVPELHKPELDFLPRVLRQSFDDAACQAVLARRRGHAPDWAPPFRIFLPVFHAASVPGGRDIVQNPPALPAAGSGYMRIHGYDQNGQNLPAKPLNALEKRFFLSPGRVDICVFPDIVSGSHVPA